MRRFGRFWRLHYFFLDTFLSDKQLAFQFFTIIKGKSLEYVLVL